MTNRERQFGGLSANLLGATGGVLATRLAAAGTLYWLEIVIARMFGPRDLGNYFIALTIVMLSSTIAMLGLGEVVIRHAASRVQQKDHQLRLYGTVVPMVSAASVLAAGAALLAIATFGSAPAPFNALMALSVVPTVVSSVHTQFLRARGVFVSSTLSRYVLPAASTFALLMVHGGRSATWLAAAFLLGRIIGAGGTVALWSLVFRSSLLDGLRSINRQGKTSTIPIITLLRPGSKLLVASGSSMILAWSDILMVGLILGPVAAGMYGAASRIATAVGLVEESVAVTTGPRMSKIFSHEGGEELKALVWRLVWRLLFASSIGIALAASQSGRLLGLYGHEFLSASSVLIVLLFAQALAVVFGPVRTALVMAGREGAVTIGFGGAAILNILLNVLLLGRIGIMGAAVATLVALFARQLFLVVVLRRSFS